MKLLGFACNFWQCKKSGVPSLQEFMGVSQKQVSISRLPELEQDLPEVLNPQLFHGEITKVHKNMHQM